MGEVPGGALVLCDELLEKIIVGIVPGDDRFGHTLMSIHVHSIKRSGSGDQSQIPWMPGIQKTFLHSEGKLLGHTGIGHTGQRNNVTVFYKSVNGFARGVKQLVFHTYAS